MKKIYGFVNCAAFNLNPEGDERWFLTRKARDMALRRFRKWAVKQGLSVQASCSGIYPIEGWEQDHEAEAEEAMRTGDVY
jgi:hypothetical protein